MPLTEDQIQFIKDNKLIISAYEMSKMFGKARNYVATFMRNNGIVVPKEIKIKFRQNYERKSIVTPEQDEIIKEKYLEIPVKRLAKILSLGEGVVFRRIKKLGLFIPEDLAQQRKLDSQRKKGDTPLNKGKKMSKEQYEKCKSTKFKKGQKSKNECKDGDITIRSGSKKRGAVKHKYIRISKGVWKELQIFNWENINGPVPKGYILACLDGDTLNCDPTNWKLMSKADNARRNAPHKKLPDNYVASLIAGRNNKELKNEIIKIPELLELKRESLKLKKIIHESNTNDAR